MWLGVSLGCAAGGVYSDVDEAARLTLSARQQYQAGRYLSAAALYERALTIQESVLPADDPMIARLVTNLGLSYRASGDLERAEPLLQRALPLYEAMRPPRSLNLADAQTHLGLLYRSMGDSGRAEPLLVSALALREEALPATHPLVAGALSSLGLLYYDTGDYARAEPLLARALELREGQLEVKASAFGRGHPDVVRLRVRLGWLYARRGEYARAEPLLRRAQQADPTSTRIYVTLVSEYEREGRTPEVIEVYESWLRIDPEQPGVKNNLAWLLASVEEPTPWDLDRALELARGAREGMPESPSVADTLGWVMLRQNRPQAAVALFRESVAGHAEGSAERAAVRYRLAQAYERAGDRNRSIQELEAALDETAVFQERPAAVTLLARLLAERGQLSSAAAHRATP
jgi:tetratricopeptide (TPR) repeat protein